MKTQVVIMSLFAAVLQLCAVRADGLADLANPDDVMLRKPAAKVATEQKAAAEQKAVAEQKAAAEQKTVAEQKAAAEQKVAAAERDRLLAQIAAEKKARAEAEAKAALERKTASVAIEQARESARLKAEAEKAQAAAEKKAERLANPDPDERPVAKKPEPAVKLEAPAAKEDVTATVPDKPAAKAAKKKQLTGRAAIITADRTDYDRKEGVILFDRNVHLDDEQYQMHADRVFVFLSGTNDLKRVVALGNVSITNETKTAACAKAVYSREQQRIVMFAADETHPAWLRDAGGKAGDESEVAGRRITYWLDSGLASVEGPIVRFHGLKGTDNPKDLFNMGKSGKGKDKAKAADEGK